MRALPLCVAFLSLSAGAQGVRERPSAATSSIVIVQNGPVEDFDADGASTTPLVADAVDSVTIAVAVRDAEGEPIANLPIRVDVTGTRNIVTPAAASFTDVNGLFIANLTTTTAETKTITVVVDPGPAEVMLHDRPSVTFRAGPVTHFDVALDGSGREVTLTARDFFGNLAAEYRATVRLTAAER
jgi:adhesin/invasin